MNQAEFGLGLAKLNLFKIKTVPKRPKSIGLNFKFDWIALLSLKLRIIDLVSKVEVLIFYFCLSKFISFWKWSFCLCLWLSECLDRGKRLAFTLLAFYVWVSCTVYKTHKPFFLAKFLLKVGHMILFTYLKIILL